MGRSYTAKAGFALEFIEKTYYGGSNFNDTGMFELGPTRPDNAISGSVYKSLGGNIVRKIGSFKVEADGTVSRFPGLGKVARESAREYAEAKYNAIFGRGLTRAVLPVAG